MSEDKDTLVKMTAVDTLHVSSAGPDNIAPGGEFEVHENVAKSLEDRGLATRAGKASAPHANKMDKAPISNKSVKAK